MDQLHSHVSKAPCQILRKILESLTGQTSLIMSRLSPFLSNVYLPLTSKPKSQSDHHLQNVGRCQHRVYLPGKKLVDILRSKRISRMGLLRSRKKGGEDQTLVGLSAPSELSLGGFAPLYLQRHHVRSELVV